MRRRERGAGRAWKGLLLCRPLETVAKVKCTEAHVAGQGALHQFQLAAWDRLLVAPSRFGGFLELTQSAGLQPEDCKQVEAPGFMLQNLEQGEE